MKTIYFLNHCLSEKNKGSFFGLNFASLISLENKKVLFISTSLTKQGFNEAKFNTQITKNVIVPFSLWEINKNLNVLFLRSNENKETNNLGISKFIVKQIKALPQKYDYLIVDLPIQQNEYTQYFYKSIKSACCINMFNEDEYLFSSLSVHLNELNKKYEYDFSTIPFIFFTKTKDISSISMRINADITKYLKAPLILFENYDNNRFQNIPLDEPWSKKNADLNTLLKNVNERIK